jgi:hypothetical protein
MCVHFYEIILIYCITFIGNILTVVLLRNHVHLHFCSTHPFFKKFCSVYGEWRCSCTFLTLALGRDWVVRGKTVWCPFQRILGGPLAVGTWWQREKSFPLLEIKPWCYISEVNRKMVCMLVTSLGQDRTKADACAHGQFPLFNTYIYSGSSNKYDPRMWTGVIFY